MPPDTTETPIMGSRGAKGMKHNGEDVTALTVRVPRDIVSDIDHEREARAARVPRNTWLLEVSKR